MAPERAPETEPSRFSHHAREMASQSSVGEALPTWSGVSNMAFGASGSVAFVMLLAASEKPRWSSIKASLRLALPTLRVREKLK